MPQHTAVETIVGDGNERFVLTCEHAGVALPPPWRWSEEDMWLVDTHWACDIGAAAFTRVLAAHAAAPAVLSTFTRLLVDPNRPLDSDTLFRGEAEGRAIALNASVDQAEAARRLDGFYWPYHRAASRMVGASRAEVVLGIHTFTSNYEGNSRSLEVGVLFDREDELGSRLVDHLRQAGFVAAPNEPYSGKEGLAYSPVLHADEFGKRALEIEARQDLIVDAEFSRQLADSLSQFLSKPG